MKDLNIQPCKWHMRIWDEDKHEWLFENCHDALSYYGFDIRGGEVTVMQGMDAVYRNFLHRNLIWEQSTGLKDKNDKEIYEGDILWWEHYNGMNGKMSEHKAEVYYDEKLAGYFVSYADTSLSELIMEEEVYINTNIHESPELLKEVRK